MIDLNPEEIKKLDPSNFRQFIVDFPNQFEEGLNLAKNIKVQGDFNKVVVSGMGGSALPVNILQSYLYDYFFQNKGRTTPTIIIPNRFYSLPAESYDRCLNILSSYSGTTEETISAFEEAINNKLPSIGVSHGGNIEQMCAETKTPFVKLPYPFENFQPRMGTGYFFGIFYQILANHGLAPDKTDEILAGVKKLKENMSLFEEKGEKLAEKIKGKTPIVYASSKFASVAMVWKIKINENAKTPSFWNFFPELNHNEMVGHTNPQAKFIAIMLRDKNDDPKDYKRYEITANLIQQKGIDAEIVDMEEGDAFYKIFSTILIGDFTSYYLALSYNQDPTPVDMVEELKKILASKS
jgi:glucose/mannose-6-phosphate isomerase